MYPACTQLAGSNRWTEKYFHVSWKMITPFFIEGTPHLMRREGWGRRLARPRLPKLPPPLACHSLPRSDLSRGEGEKGGGRDTPHIPAGTKTRPAADTTPGSDISAVSPFPGRCLRSLTQAEQQTSQRERGKSGTL